MHLWLKGLQNLLQLFLLLGLRLLFLVVASNPPRTPSTLLLLE